MFLYLSVISYAKVKRFTIKRLPLILSTIKVDCRPDGHTLLPPQGILQTYPILKSSLFCIE